MNIYLKGYYGYQNRGDELLLLGFLQYLYKNFTNSQNLTIYVESGDKKRLEEWIVKNKDTLGPVANCCKVVKKYNFLQFFPRVTKVIGGGEVITDARTFPYNGWNYLFLYWLSLIFGNIIFVGGVGEPKKKFSNILWNLLLRGAKNIIVREETSYQRVLTYSNKLTLHRDFAFDVLDTIKIGKKKDSLISSQGQEIGGKYIIINCNSHYWNDEVKKKIVDFSKNFPNHRYYYFPAAMGDDSDVLYYELLKYEIPALELYDWRDYSLVETLSFFAGASSGIATRLHVLLPLQYYNIPLEAFVYQEKISKILGLK